MISNAYNLIRKFLLPNEGIFWYISTKHLVPISNGSSIFVLFPFKKKYKPRYSDFQENQVLLQLLSVKIWSNHVASTIFLLQKSIFQLDFIKFVEIFDIVCYIFLFY